MKSIIVIAPAISYPAQSGGDIRLVELCRRLSRDFELHLISYGSVDCGGYVYQLGFKSINLVPGGQSCKFGGRWLQVFDVWRNSPHGIRLDSDRIFSQKLQETLERVRSDAVLIEHVYMTQYRSIIHKIPIFVTCHNVETIKMGRWFADRKGSFISSFRDVLQIYMMRRQESTLANYARTVFVTSDSDKEILMGMNKGGRFVTVPNGADLEYFSPRSYDSFSGSPAAFFVGSLFYQPNLDSVMTLKKEIWPLVRQIIPDAVCHIAGNPGSLDMRDLHDPLNGILFHGLVADVRPYFRMSQVMVVPLRVGSGTRIKILESMATATPVVSTAVGAEGIDCTNNLDILLGETPKELAFSVIRLLSDRELAFRMGMAGRALVEKRYSWDSSADLMCRELQNEIK
jgi:glycosyltransferase involved in cell wall biosynthesis